MKITIIIISLIVILSFFVGYKTNQVKQSLVFTHVSTPIPTIDIQTPNNNLQPKTRKKFSYCMPDEDPDFKLSYQDDRYYYYVGDKLIRGEVFQYDINSSVLWTTNFMQSCNFELTNNYIIDIDRIKKDFSIDEAWKNQPQCNPENGEKSLSGDYTIRIKGFKIPISYAWQYDYNRIQDQMHMSRFSFFVDYDTVETVHRESVVFCPAPPLPQI